MTVDERPYGLTKAALNSLVQGLAYRYVNEGYRINAVAPGVTVSDMVGGDANGDLRYGNITHRYYLPEEVAEVAAFLLSDASNCLNGQILVCNEGKQLMHVGNKSIRWNQNLNIQMNGMFKSL